MYQRSKKRGKPATSLQSKGLGCDFFTIDKAGSRKSQDIAARVQGVERMEATSNGHVAVAGTSKTVEENFNSSFYEATTAPDDSQESDKATNKRKLPCRHLSRLKLMLLWCWWYLKGTAKKLTNSILRVPLHKQSRFMHDEAKCFRAYF